MAIRSQLRQGVVVSMLCAIGVSLSGCLMDDYVDREHLKPISSKTKSLMAEKGLNDRAPIMIRILKADSKLEVWKLHTKTNRYILLRDYDICRWSGDLGPKKQEGDRQAPEGFYNVTPQLLNPNSSYHLSFNMGYPNLYDQAHGRTGQHLMVHGDCSSRGCYAMEDGPIEDIYALAREAFRGGQRSFQIQAVPFALTEENLSKVHSSPHFSFWQNLKTGWDMFELTGQPPRVDVCGMSYVFNATSQVPMEARRPCPKLHYDQDLMARLQEYRLKEREQFLLAQEKKHSEQSKQTDNTPQPDEMFSAYIEARKTMSSQDYTLWTKQFKPYVSKSAPEAFSLLALQSPEIVHAVLQQ